jgi:hypothetical protein
MALNYGVNASCFSWFKCICDRETGIIRIGGRLKNIASF